MILEIFLVGYYYLNIFSIYPISHKNMKMNYTKRKLKSHELEKTIRNFHIITLKNNYIKKREIYT